MGGRIIDNLQIDNRQIDNWQIDNQNQQIDNLQQLFFYKKNVDRQIYNLQITCISWNQIYIFSVQLTFTPATHPNRL